MAISSDIYGQIQAPTPTNSLADLAQVQQIQGLQNQNKLAALGFQDRQQAQLTQSTIRNKLLSLGPNPTDDQRVEAYKSTALPEGFAAADALQKSMLERTKILSGAAKDTADASKTDLETRAALQHHIADLAGSATDQASWTRARIVAGKLGADLTQVPEQFDPTTAQSIAGMAMTQAQRLAEHLKQQEFGLKANNDIMMPNGQGGYVVNQPYLDAKKQIGKAGAASVNVKVDNKLGEGVAAQVGPMMKESYESATGAQQQVGTADQLIRAIDSGKAMTGPTATLRLKGAQLAQTLGIAGKDTQEQIANTRAAVQGLAQSTVSARAALKGQGQVSDFEGRLLERAASGGIDDLTAGEIKQIAAVNKRLAQQQIDLHRQRVDKLKGNTTTAPIANFYELGTPQQADVGSDSHVPMSAIDAEIARRQKGAR